MKLEENNDMKKLKLLALILSVVLVLSVCQQCFAEQVYTPGTYTAEANGNNGAVSVSVTFSENAITDVVVGAHSETAGISDPAIERLPKAIVENQSLAVDAVSGATNTSNAILSAVEACVLLAGGDVEALKNAAVEEKENDSVQQLSCDIVVVGGGLSGLCAAAAATEMGASVICVEKLAVTGGSAQGSLGGFMACEIPENAEYHVTTNTFDSLDQALDTWIGLQDVSIVESKYPDRERLSKALVECMHTFDWLSSYGAEFVAYADDAVHEIPLIQAVVPGTEGTPIFRLLNQMKDKVIENGAQVILETPATDLIMDGDKVVGVIAKGPEGTFEITGKKVILACGGFSDSEELLKQYIPSVREFHSFSVPGHTGDGLKMAVKAGAAVFEDAWVNPGWVAPSNKFFAVNPNAAVFQEVMTPFDFSESSYHRLMVDMSGSRFLNEAEHYALQNIEFVKNDANWPFWAVYDGLNETAAAVAEDGLQTGTVVKGDTLEEAAKAAGIDPEAFIATVEKYNAICAKGEDDEFGKPASYLDKPIGSEGPYYLVQMVNSGADTLGGVKTSDNREVLREDGSIIDGLYAVGAMTNKYYYNQLYFSGSSLTFCTIDGRIAGQHAAEAVLGK